MSSETPTVQEWCALLAAHIPSKEAYSTVARHARAILAGWRDVGGGSLSTVALAEQLLPSGDIRGPNGKAAQKRLYKALSTLASGDLRDYCARGEPVERKIRGVTRLVRPVLWQAPRIPQIGDEIVDAQGARWRCVGVQS